MNSQRSTTSLVVVAVLVASTSCGSDKPARPGVDARLARVLVSDPGSGYAPAPSASAHPIDADGLVAVSPIGERSVRTALQDSGFRAGLVRVWERKPDYVVAMVLRFAVPMKAREFSTFAARSYRALPGTAVFTLTLKNGQAGVGYVLNGQVDGAVRFCQGGWFAHGDLVFHLYHCAPVPGSLRDVQPVLDAQMDALTRAAVDPAG